MIDLLGSDVPDPNHVGSFVWFDGVLVQALKNGDWIIFDELNLAN
jgi:midasin